MSGEEDKRTREQDRDGYQRGSGVSPGRSPKPMSETRAGVADPQPSWEGAN